ncbi:uncharacterized protein SPSK_10728 [Sporothrix schenckii 1099-18]|uniref:Uncharacterized protein n=1 Tax=Sporothrix schenckii 1099-18 TaxID=1397361 RepID=A0A0F2MJS0_SPOSC|nr:uncharacterized protein SPSK_10728 [Sporothrix schenckii 1099-18]KJR89877.1 hypothetical protein SPSK_10728 [Sporothrix schenckii 1099-18]
MTRMERSDARRVCKKGKNLRCTIYGIHQTAKGRNGRKQKLSGGPPILFPLDRSPSPEAGTMKNHTTLEATAICADISVRGLWSILCYDDDGGPRRTA